MRTLTRFALIGLALVAPLGALPERTAPSVFQEPLSPRIANYAIDVKLQPDLRMIKGAQVLTWVNKSPVAIQELQFHLYLNGFRSSQSTFIRESGGRMRGASLDDNGWGFIEVDSIRLPSRERLDLERMAGYWSPLPGMVPMVADPPTGDASDDGSRATSPLGNLPLNGRSIDLTELVEFLRPEDGNPHDLTLFRIPLPQALPPGEAVALEIEFHAQLPTPPFARTGAKEEYFMVGQWFPKIAVHTGEQWNAHQFHYHSEFFADFGVYDVDITVPSDHVVGATGQEFDRIDHDDGTSTHRYHAEDVHDFAWTSSPDYVEFNGTADDVAIRVLMQKDNLDLAQLHLDATATTIRHFQSTWGDYPFPNFTVVDPRRGAGGSGGMEYPTIVTAGTRRSEIPGLTTLMIQAVIMHEFGHNYWYHLLASNEAEESWLDEGVNTYTDIRTAEAAFSRTFLGLEVDSQAVNRFFLVRPISDPVKTPSWGFATRGSYGSNSYSRPGTILETLRSYLGAERMNLVMRSYVERWRFRHPKTEDFIAVVNEVSGENLDWFFDQALYGTETLDYSVTEITNREVKKAGYDFTRSVESPWDGQGPFAQSNSEVLTASAEGTDAADPRLETMGEEATDAATDVETADQSSETSYRSSVLVQRLGGFVFPVRLQVEFNDGTVAEELWSGEERWRRFEWIGSATIVSATVDPEGKIPLDRNLMNNGRVVSSNSLGTDRLSGTIRWIAQVALDLLSL